MVDEASLISSALGNWQPRFVVAGVEIDDLLGEIIPSSTHWREWYRAWCRVGEKHESLGNQALMEGNEISAGEAFARAAVYYHFSQFTLPRYPDLKKEGTFKKVEAYKKAAPRLVPYARRVEIPFEGKSMPAYLRMPPHVVRPPVVLLLPGADSCKEEFMTLEAHFLKRGMATLSVDGPGQGETRYRMPLRPDYERAVSAVIDYLEDQPYLDSTEIGVCGISLGGTFAIRAGAHDSRVKAVVDVAGFYHIHDWDQLGPLLKETLIFLFDALSEEDAREKASTIDLRDVITKIRCPMLIIHGVLDRIVPVEEARILYEKARCEKELVLYPEGNHVCNNIPYKYRPRMADWLRSKLLKR